MAKGSNQFRWIILLLAAAGVIGYIATEPDGATPKRSQPKSAQRSEATGDEITQEDRTAKFLPVNLSERNAFKPLIARQPAGMGGALMADPSLIPPLFAGGEANWAYTGTAQIDGVSMALIENRQTGEGVFLRLGEQWKSMKIAAIGEESIDVVGPDGDRRTLRLGGLPSGPIEEEGLEPATVSGPIPGLTAVPQGVASQPPPAAAVGEAPPETMEIDEN